jgi:hypothetical protein
VDNLSFGAGGGGEWSAYTEPVIASPIGINYVDEQFRSTDYYSRGGFLSENTKTIQKAPVDPSNGELMMLDNNIQNTYDLYNDVPRNKVDTVASIGGNGEIAPTTVINGGVSKDMFSDIKSQVIIGVIVAVLSAIIIVALTRRK